ncbi:MAG: glycosyltransferase family 2 protein [Betaproteobacteria bacterium]|nr:glycosyltransferase family 2 protein [Betaproteobacteria bacterium]
MRIAVIVATYNRPDALAALLEGYLHQDDDDYELIVADDGSRDDVRKVVKSFSGLAHIPIMHLWHEDCGFRAAIMRNRGIAATRAEYLIYTDGDCVPPRDFVSRHRRLAEPGYFLSGNRILLSEMFTSRVLERRLPLYDWSVPHWVGAWLRGGINRWLPLVRLPDGDFRKRTPDRWEGVKTCNLSAWRKDLIAVNGFDEAYAGKWGLEDSDLTIRLIHAGIKHKSARFAAPVFHLWHREADKRGFDENQRLLDELIASKRSRARIGVDQYL